MAIVLPLELQQHVFQYLDPRSFNAARNVCRWWRHASQNSVTLAQQLRQLPVAPVSAKTFDAESLGSLYNEAAHLLMLSMRVGAPVSDGQPLSTRIDKPKIAISKDGRRAATLEDREISLWDLESQQCKVIAHRPLNDLRTAIGGGPWFKCAPTSVYELAMSSDGTLLAVALERTIQIYDLTMEDDSWPVSSYIPSASGHYIAGLEFQHNNSLLRVQLSNKGAVVYLGSPQDSVQGLKHWQSKGGLKHAFLDSSKAILRPLSATRVPETLAGLQLLQPLENGWLFAAQKRCTTTHSACYCLGHVATPILDNHVATAQLSTSILAELPSSMSSTPLPEIVHGFWQDLPSAHVQHPHFSLSPDGSLLAMSENVSVAAYTESFSRVFVFRVPSAARLTTDLQDLLAREEKLGNKEEEAVVNNNNDISSLSLEKSHAIQRLPLSIGTIHGKVLDFGFDDTSSSSCGTRGRYQLSATTELGPQTWSLLDSLN